MTAVEASGPCGAGSLATDGVSYAPLLAESDEAAAARWQTLGDSELDAEITAYRAALRAATAELDGTAAAQPCGGLSGEPFRSEAAGADRRCVADYICSTRHMPCA